MEAVIAWHLPLMVGGYRWPPVEALAATDFGRLAGQVLTDSITAAVGSGDPVPVTWRAGLAPALPVPACAGPRAGAFGRRWFTC